MADVLETRVEELLSQLTLEEKAALTVGRDAWSTQPVERLGVPSVWLSDGPTGLRKARAGGDMSVGQNIPATCFPTESALGASWDVALVREIAAAIAVEAQAEDVQVVLGPGVNLKRSPLCGRNFEYFAEDPVLSGKLAAAFISGLQERGVGASLKHFVANESETDRMAADSIVDERTLREVYLRPFEIAVRDASPWTVMEGYNRLNGTHCAEHRWLLHDVLVGEWGFDGIVVSDWFAVNDRVAGIDAGLHLQMPGTPTAAQVVAAVRDGRLDEARLDEIARRLLGFVLRADAARRPGTTVDRDAHHALARRAAAECVVLLRNEGGLLPLREARVALLGAFGVTPRYQGAGSSQVVPTRPVENLHDELAALLGAGGVVTHASGYNTDGTTDEELLQEARRVAADAPVAVVVVGLPGMYEEEGADRTHLDLPAGHNALVEAVLEVQPRVAVVLLNGSAVALPWAERVPALVDGWLGGQASGGALADVLTGRVNPSGKLAETFPARLEDTPAYLTFPHDGSGRLPFSEGLFTGYRWYDARRIAPLFPFGHGLAYTTFAYRDLRVGDDLSVTLTVQNTGDRMGREVVQFYLRERQSRLQRPEQELRAFAKVALESGEATEVRLTLVERDFAVYDVDAGGWVVTSREFEVLVGASSRDIRLRGSITLPEQLVALPRFGRLTPLRDWLTLPAARALVRPAISALQRQYLGGESLLPQEGGAPGDITQAFVADMPASKLVLFGVVTETELDDLIAMANATITRR